MEASYKKLKGFIKKDPKKLLGLAAKVGEESGELIAEVLKLQGLKGTTDNKETIKQMLLLEGVDVLAITLGVLAEQNHDFNTIQTLLKDKIDEWDIKVKRKKTK